MTAAFVAALPDFVDKERILSCAAGRYRSVFGLSVAVCGATALCAVSLVQSFANLLKLRSHSLQPRVASSSGSAEKAGSESGAVHAPLITSDASLQDARRQLHAALVKRAAAVCALSALYALLPVAPCLFAWGAVDGMSTLRTWRIFVIEAARIACVFALPMYGAVALTAARLMCSRRSTTEASLEEGSPCASLSATP